MIRYNLQKAFLLFLFVLFYGYSFSQTEPQRTMHRIQDTTRSASGWYFGKSTDGHFSIEFPVPFNDFTIAANGIQTYVVGIKSDEGIKFSALEVTGKKKKRKLNMDSFMEGFKESGTTISNISRAETDELKSIYFETTNAESRACMKYIYTRNRLYTIIIEYPILQESLVNQLKDHYFSSFQMLL